MKAAYQGEAGAYSEEAGLAYFNAVEMIPQPSFEDVFEVVSSGSCQLGLIPIENSLAGSIHRNFDLLMQHQLYIRGEYFLRVRHCLIGNPGAELRKVKQAISHPQALSQCAGWLRKRSIQPQAVYDTAGSVKMLKDSGSTDTAAIASKRAAEIYQMDILQESIEDNPQNYTRFLEIGLQPAAEIIDPKTTIVFTLKNQPGALHQALGKFASRDINLTKIESRPLLGAPWEYLFYIEFPGGQTERKIKSALDDLKTLSSQLRILGTYARHIA